MFGYFFQKRALLGLFEKKGSLITNFGGGGVTDNPLPPNTPEGVDYMILVYRDETKLLQPGNI